MTSELRPAVAVWEADRELTIAALHAWAEHIGAGYSCPAAAQTMLMAATIMQADREAVRAYWYRQGKDDGVEQERGNIVEWLMREEEGYPASQYSGFAAMIREAIEAGEHLV